MVTRITNLVLLLMLAVGLHDFSAAQQAQKPLTNADVLAMVKNHMAESVVISAIQSSPTKFNTSASELIRLKKLGVTDNEMNAMLRPRASRLRLRQAQQPLPTTLARKPRLLTRLPPPSRACRRSTFSKAARLRK